MSDGNQQNDALGMMFTPLPCSAPVPGKTAHSRTSERRR